MQHHTLLLRLAGPMQAWGTQSRFDVRDTGHEPSKSGVIGLIAAALGRPRNEPIDDLVHLRMGVRVEREGTIKRDFHTALNVAKSHGGKPKDCEPSHRYYLADAEFLVGLQTTKPQDLQTLQKIQNALQNPAWQLYLGRKAFVPSKPIHIPDGLRPGTLEQALDSYGNPPPGTRVVLETPDRSGPEIRQDQPRPLSFLHRKFATRYTITLFTPINKQSAKGA